MRRQTPLAHVLYAYIFPHPTANDPPSFAAYLARSLVPEVRIEVATFYGDLNSAEARYPGLNYCHAPHRMRLGRFKHHKRLFDAFDSLGLTYNEIQEFCCWEGTKWARERYEKDEGITVHDTTGNDIQPYTDRRELRVLDERRRHSITRQTDISVIIEEADGALSMHVAEEDEEMSDAECDVEEDGEEAESEEAETAQETPFETSAREQHVAELHRRRDDGVQQRIITSWDRDGVMTPELEQYLKEASERGDVDAVNWRSMMTGRAEARSLRTSAARATGAVSTRAAV
ncbi:hypothetical protein LTR08_001588 [Meristemomyces frigidus]|nr:hypothetical protein LTR08_001588 [Meristemomyces frigidus]